MINKIEIPEQSLKDNVISEDKRSEFSNSSSASPSVKKESDDN